MATNPNVPPLTGLAPDLTVSDPIGWTPATELTSGAAIDGLLDAAKQRWRAAPHAAGALAWKSYSYWLALPALLGYASARRVPLVRPGGVVVRWAPHQPVITIGLTSVDVAVLPADPLALLPAASRDRQRITVVPDDAALIAAMRTSLMHEHLEPVMGQIRSRLHLGQRTLWGSLASGVAHGLSRAADALPGPILATAGELLAGLGIDDLVELAELPDDQPGLSVQRRTCCLAFTLPEPKICSGCCIR
jgi:hypothetical protein